MNGQRMGTSPHSNSFYRLFSDSVEFLRQEFHKKSIPTILLNYVYFTQRNYTTITLGFINSI